MNLSALKLVLISVGMFSSLCFSSAIYAQSNPALDITTEEKQVLSEIRNNIFGGARLDAAFRKATLSGLEPPVFPYEIDNRGLIVWEIDPEQVDAFSAQVGIASPFSLAKVRPLTVQGTQTISDRLLSFLEGLGLERLSQRLFPEKYYVFADVGNTSRAEQGAKVEFKTFVRLPGDSEPRVYRFDSHKAIPGTDLLQLSNFEPKPITINAVANEWSGQLNTADGSLLWSVPVKTKNGESKKNKRKRFSEWYLNASERVFGPMGASSRYYYDGSSVSGKFLSIKSKKAEITNTFPWAQYAVGQPDIYLAAIKTEFMVQPVTAAVVPPLPPLGTLPVVACELAPLSDPTAGLFIPQSTNSSDFFASLLGCALAGADPQSVFGTLFYVAQTAPQVLPPQEIPTLYFALLDVYQGFSILGGFERPKMFFSLLTQPKTIFINFEIPENRAKAFEEDFLPEHFNLAKIRFYPEQRKAVYAVSLNVYQSVGQNLNGFRAEWSTYVINPNEEEPRPRFSVLEAQTNAGGFDPIVALERYVPGMDFTDPQTLAQLIEPPSDLFLYEEDLNEGIEITVRDAAEEIELDVDIAYPVVESMLHTKPTTTWMEANDFVYWGEVADVLKYDRQVMFADLLVFEAKNTDLVSDTTFEGYVNPDPLPVIIWNGAQDIALEPWGNLEAL